MLRLILKRLLQTLVVVFFLVTFTFFAVRAAPGSPFAGEKNLPQHVQAQLEADFAMDKSLPEQFAIFWKKVLLEGDFGPSMTSNDYQASQIIAESFPVSLQLGLLAMLFGVGIGIPLGIIAALRKNGLIDYFSMILALAGICIPAFVLGPLLQLSIAAKVPFLNVAGWNSPSDIILPAITLGVGVAAYVARLTRGGMLDVLSQDFIRTARAKGLPTSKIVTRHALRGALIPAVTYLGPAFAAVITGSFVVETIFGIPGMGQHFVNSVTKSDYTLLQALVFFYGILMGVANLTVDIALAWLNPRLRA